MMSVSCISCEKEVDGHRHAILSVLRCLSFDLCRGSLSSTRSATFDACLNCLSGCFRLQKR